MFKKLEERFNVLSKNTKDIKTPIKHVEMKITVSERSGWG